MPTKQQWLDAIDDTLEIWERRLETGRMDSSSCPLCTALGNGDCADCPVTRFFGEDCAGPDGPSWTWDEERDASHAITSLILLREIVENGL